MLCRHLCSCPNTQCSTRFRQFMPAQQYETLLVDIQTMNCYPQASRSSISYTCLEDTFLHNSLRKTLSRTEFLQTLRQTPLKQQLQGPTHLPAKPNSSEKRNLDHLLPTSPVTSFRLRRLSDEALGNLSAISLTLHQSSRLRDEGTSDNRRRCLA